MAEEQIRRALPEDAAAICRINREALGYAYDEASTRLRLDSLLPDPIQAVFTAICRNRAMGYVHVCEYRGTYFEPLANIMALAVLPEAQGLGLGRRLLQAAEDWAQNRGLAGVRLNSGMDRTGAHAFYRRVGYTLRKEQKNFIRYFEQKEAAMHTHPLPANPNEKLSFDPGRLRPLYLAGGCFWGVQAYLSRVPGVFETQVGYANGESENPSYEEVCGGATGHAETVFVRYQPELVSLEMLLQHYFGIIDPTLVNRQGADKGTQYRTGIFYTDPEELSVIRTVMERVQRAYEKPLAVQVEPLRSYYPAEEYHQRYLEKNPGGYCHVRFENLQAAAVDPSPYRRESDETLKTRLTPQQYAVTRQNDTEAPFTGAYWDNHEEGLYVDVTTGEPLFSSRDKFDSGCGWPSFARPLDADVVTERRDDSLTPFGRVRTEVRSRVGDAHLGHVFTDGPSRLGGLRYCINSAAVRFIPYDEMEKEGYGAYKHLVR